MGRLFLVIGFFLIVFESNANQVSEEFDWDQNAQQLFNRANYLMDQMQVTDAMAIYREIEKRGEISGPLFANMAFGYIRKDSLGMAKYYLMKSAQFSQTRSRANETLDFVNTRLESRTGTLPRLTMYVFSSWLRYDVGTSKIFVWGLALLNLSGLIFAWVMVKRVKKWPLPVLGGLLAFFALILIITGVYLHQTRDAHRKSVVVSRELVLHELPDTISQPVGLAYEGFTITLDRAKKAPYPGWAYARMSNGLSGWVQERNLRTF